MWKCKQALQNTVHITVTPGKNSLTEEMGISIIISMPLVHAGTYQTHLLSVLHDDELL